ncbi:MAG TPA: VWA domain-containing protein [Thermoanaerobaculia bacterium]|jgi:VWFA-related protein|nr:VWA domain-containing protein [Thermoanaerobaculia bacterium]
MARPAALLAVTFGLALGIPAAAQTPAQTAHPGVFGEALDVRVVNVEVVVTDKKGTRVDGLRAEDFTLEVDGKVVPIDYFAEVVGGRVGEGGTAEAPAAAVPPAAEAGAPLGVSWLVFVDDYFSVQRDRNQVLEALSKQLGHLGPADRMAVVAFDGKRLTMLSTWSDSPRALERALAAAEKRPAMGLQRLAERRSLVDDQDQRTRGGLPRMSADPTHLDPDERRFVDLLTSQVQRSVGAAAATLRAFAAPPGRKAMLLLSGGWPWRPVDSVVADPNRVVTESTVGAEPLFRPLADVANLLGYTLYPVDVPGMSQRLVDVSLGGPPSFGSAIAESRREQDLHLSLDWLAETTGGRAFLNANRLSVFEETVTDTRSFYWLGFTPKRSGDDKPHAVKVTVKRPGLEVRSRNGFLDASRNAEVSMAVESALLFGNPASSLPLQVAVGKPEKMRGRTMKVPIVLQVPLDQLTPLPTADGQVVQVELRVGAQDADGNTAAIPVIPLQMKLAGPVKPGDTGRYATDLLLRRGEHDLVIALYEPVSGKVFSASARIAP